MRKPVGHEEGPNAKNRLKPPYHGDYGLSLPATCDLQEVAISSPGPL